MADPIMDLFEDTPLFNLDALPDDSFTQGSSDPVEEALKLALGQVDPPTDSELTVNTGLNDPVVASAIPEPVQVPVQQPVPVMAPQTVSIASAPSVTPAPASVDGLQQIQVQTSIPVVSNTSVATSSTVLLSSPLTVSSPPATTTATTQLTQIAQQLTPQQLAAITQQAGGKIVILKGPQGQAQVLQTVSGATSQAGGKVIRVLSGTPLKPGMSILQGATVLNQTSPGQAQIKVGTTGVQRVLQSPNGPVKQVLLTSVPQQAQGQAVQVQIPAQATIDQGQNQVQIQPQGQIQVQPQAQAAQIQVQAPGQVQLQPAMQAQTPVSALTSKRYESQFYPGSFLVFFNAYSSFVLCFLPDFFLNIIIIVIFFLFILGWRSKTHHARSSATLTAWLCSRPSWYVAAAGHTNPAGPVWTRTAATGPS